jgi:dTDP-4-amino-4,6-dideoxygalactose transaminase
MDQITARRRDVYQFYLESLSTLAEQELLTIPRAPENCVTNYHMFHILLNDAKTRDGLMAHLKRDGISAVFHYVPLHDSVMGTKYERKGARLPVTEDLSARLLRLPFFADITRDEQIRVVRSILEFFDRPVSASSSRQHLSL